MLDLARTAVDIAREHGTPYGEIACDSAMRRGVTPRRLEAAVAPMTYWPYSRRPGAPWHSPTRGPESVLETLGRLLVAELGVGRIELQFPLTLEDGGSSGATSGSAATSSRPHGKIKYLTVEEGGLADDRPRRWSGPRGSASG